MKYIKGLKESYRAKQVEHDKKAAEKVARYREKYPGRPMIQDVFEDAGPVGKTFFGLFLGSLAVFFGILILLLLGFVVACVVV